VKTTVPVLIALTVLSGPAAADSIGTTYDMDRMLSEPHPLANEYGSRWQQLQQRQPMPGMLYRPAVPPAPVLKPASPRSLPSPTAPPAPQAPAAPHHSPPRCNPSRAAATQLRRRRHRSGIRPGRSGAGENGKDRDGESGRYPATEIRAAAKDERGIWRVSATAKSARRRRKKFEQPSPLPPLPPG